MATNSRNVFSGFNSRAATPVANVANVAKVAAVPSPVPTEGVAVGASGLLSSFSGKSKEVLGKLSIALEGKTGYIFAFVIVVIAFVFVIVFILRELNDNTYKQGTTLSTQVIKLSDIDDAIEFPGSDIPSKKLGEQHSYAFWMYLDGFTQTKDLHKIVFYRGEKGTVATANPIVMMDGETNKLYFVIKTKDSSLSSANANIKYNNLKPIVDRNYFANKKLRYIEQDVNKHLILSVNNVPFSRWVHFAISVKDNMITLFQDGEIYAVKTINDFVQSKPMDYDLRGEPIKLNPIIDDTVGSMYVGRNSNLAGKSAPNGYLSKLQAFNYALTVSDIQKVYKEGPFSANLLQKFGVTGYGVQSPIYKLKSVA